MKTSEKSESLVSQKASGQRAESSTQVWGLPRLEDKFCFSRKTDFHFLKKHMHKAKHMTRCSVIILNWQKKNWTSHYSRYQSTEFFIFLIISPQIFFFHVAKLLHRVGKVRISWLFFGFGSVEKVTIRPLCQPWLQRDITVEPELIWQVWTILITA